MKDAQGYARALGLLRGHGRRHRRRHLAGKCLMLITFSRPGRCSARTCAHPIRFATISRHPAFGPAYLVVSQCVAAGTMLTDGDMDGAPPSPRAGVPGGGGGGVAPRDDGGAVTALWTFGGGRADGGFGAGSGGAPQAQTSREVALPQESQVALRQAPGSSADGMGLLASRASSPGGSALNVIFKRYICDMKCSHFENGQ